MFKYFQKFPGLLYFLKFIGWIFFFLLLLEILTRNFIMQYPSEHFVQGLGNIAVDYSVMVNGTEGFAVTHYLNNGEVATPYHSGSSVVVLGDSFTEAGQVSDNQKYVSVAETTLHERGISMDLHNLGYSGRSLPDYVYIAPFVKKNYAPAIVVVQLDLSDFVESFDQTKENYFARAGASVTLRRNENFSANQLVLRNMIRSVALVSFARYKFKSMNLVPEQQLRALAAGAAASPTAISQANSLDLDAVKLQINALQAAYPEAELAILIIPGVPVIRDGALAWNVADEDAMMELLNRLPNLHLIYPRQEFVELYATSQKFPRGFFNTLPDIGHLNVDGNYAVGMALANYLETLAK